MCKLDILRAYGMHISHVSICYILFYFFHTEYLIVKKNPVLTLKKLICWFTPTAEQQSGVSAWGARQQWTDPIGNGAGAGPYHPGAAPPQRRCGGPPDSSSSFLSTLPRIRYILSGWRRESGPQSAASCFIVVKWKLPRSDRNRVQLGEWVRVFREKLLNGQWKDAVLR